MASPAGPLRIGPDECLYLRLCLWQVARVTTSNVRAPWPSKLKRRSLTRSRKQKCMTRPCGNVHHRPGASTAAMPGLRSPRVLSSLSLRGEPQYRSRVSRVEAHLLARCLEAFTYRPLISRTEQLSDNFSLRRTRDQFVGPSTDGQRTSSRVHDCRSPHLPRQAPSARCRKLQQQAPAQCRSTRTLPLPPL